MLPKLSIQNPPSQLQWNFNVSCTLRSRGPFSVQSHAFSLKGKQNKFTLNKLHDPSDYHIMIRGKPATHMTGINRPYLFQPASEQENHLDIIHRSAAQSDHTEWPR